MLSLNRVCLISQTIQAPTFYRRKAEPRNVASVILGGGAGTQLFPLTSRSATPAVRKQLNCFLLKNRPSPLLNHLLCLLLLCDAMMRSAGSSGRMLQAYRHPHEQLHQQRLQQDFCTYPVQLCFPESTYRTHLFWKWYQFWGWICRGKEPGKWIFMLKETRISFQLKQGKIGEHLQNWQLGLMGSFIISSVPS